MSANQAELRVSLALIAIGSCLSGCSNNAEPTWRDRWHASLNVFLTDLREANQLTLFEGLPHQSEEKELLAQELAAKSTVRHLDFPFYEESVAVSDKERGLLLSILLDRSSYEPSRGRNKSLCEDYHPDWHLVWNTDHGEYEVAICFGCGEAELVGPHTQLHALLNSEAYQRLHELLKQKRHQRPTNDQQGL